MHLGQVEPRKHVSSYQPKYDVAQYECHTWASAAYGFRATQSGKPSSDRKIRKPKLVSRAVDAHGLRLPTEKEISFVEAIAGYIRFSLPDNFRDHLWFVRSFLNTFTYGHSRNSTSKSEVKRRCSIAQEFAFEQRPYRELANKLGLRPECAELLLEYGRQRIPKYWLRTDDRIVDWDSDNDETYLAKPKSSVTDWFVADTDETDFDTIMNSFHEIHDAHTNDEPDQADEPI